MASPHQKVVVIGFLHFIEFILTTISVFTKSWVVETISIGGHIAKIHEGIVPLDENEYAWATAASYMMFISLAIFFILILVYIYTAYKVHHGCYHRYSFYVITVLSLIIAILEITSFIIMAINVPKSGFYHNSLYADESMGYSEYLELLSAILLIVSAGVSGHVSSHDCR